MKGIRAIAGSFAILAVIASPSAWSANPVTDSARVRLQSRSIQMLRETAAKASMSAPTGVTLQSTAHKIAIVVINSPLNNGDVAGRSDDAARIVAAIEKKISQKKEFEQVMMIHVDYVQQQTDHPDLVQGFDFNKAPSGAFVPHKT